MEPSGEAYTEKMSVAISGPPGDESAEFEKTKPFEATYFKVVLTLSTEQGESRIVTAILDTGAGLNLIQE